MAVWLWVLGLGCAGEAGDSGAERPQAESYALTDNSWALHQDDEPPPSLEAAAWTVEVDGWPPEVVFLSSGEVEIDGEAVGSWSDLGIEEGVYLYTVSGEDWRAAPYGDPGWYQWGIEAEGPTFGLYPWPEP